MDNQYLNTISGAGGDSGGSSAPPSEIPDSLHSKTYAKVLDLLCEGPIEGLVNGDNSIYFNGTPLMNKDGSYNFKDVTLGVRLGTQDQLPIDNFNQIESEYAINTEITNITPQTFTVSDPVVTKVRVALAIPSLYYQEDDGDIVGTSVSYAMYMQKNGSPGTGAVVTPGTIDNGCIYSVPITNGGSGYSTAGTTITITGAGTSAAITPTVSNGVVSNITVTTQGSGYTWMHAVVNGTGTGAELAIIPELYDIDNGYKRLSEIIVIKGGSGYGTAGTTITITGDGVSAAATATVVNGRITGLTVTNAGKNYTTATTFAAVGSGSGATFGTPTIHDGVLKTINVVSGGADYVSPIALIRDISAAGTATGAVATVTVSAGVVTAVTVTNGGYGYTTAGTKISIASGYAIDGGFYPIGFPNTPQYNIGTVTINLVYPDIYSSTMAVPYSYYGTMQKSKAILALVDYYKARSGISEWYSLYGSWKFGYDAYSAVTEMAIFRHKDWSATGDLVYTNSFTVNESTLHFFALEPVTVYNYPDSEDPNYEPVADRLRQLSPDAPEALVQHALKLATIYGWIFPIPYCTLEFNEAVQANTWQYVVYTKAPYMANWQLTSKVGFYNVQAWYSQPYKTINGKTTSKYTINHTFNLPRTSDSDTFTIRVEKLTPEPTNSRTQNSLYLDSYAHIVPVQLSYPNSAIVGTTIDSSNFSSIPTRGYHVKLLKISIPTTYNPLSGLYNRNPSTGNLVYDGSGNPVEQVWDGTFYTAWSNNPAWCFYDLLLNSRYGLGEYITPDLVDEYSLYSIGKYCDELVPNGYGGLERRFTLNAYIQTKQEAIKLLQTMASVFRGMVYWSSGGITAVNDAGSSTAVYQFNNSNVIDGTFNYSGASRKVIHNAILVSWNDPQLLYKQRIEYVEDRDAIDRYGYNPSDVIAFGCTSRGQAHRLGRAILYTEKVENNLVSFKAALDASYIRPGLLIKVSDEVRSGTAAGGPRLAGRVLSTTAPSTITLDRTITLEPTYTYKIRLNTIDLTPDPNLGFTDALKTVEYTLTSVASTTSVSTITVTTTITDTVIGPNTIWSIYADNLIDEELFRILSIKESDTVGTYDIVAMLHNPGKYDYIDNNLALDPTDYTTLNQLPAQVTFAAPVANPDYPATSDIPYISSPIHSGIYRNSSGGIASYLNINFNQTLYAVRYDVYLSKNAEPWVKVAADIIEPTYTYYNSKDGAKYRVKVIAKNFGAKEGKPGIWPPLTETAYTALGKLAKPSNVTGLTVVVPATKDAINLSWNAVTDLDLAQYEIRRGGISDTWDTALGHLGTTELSAVKPPIVAGTYKYFIKAKDTSKLYSIVADEETLVINKPNTPVINVGSSTVVGSDYKLVWSNAESTFQIKNYFIYRDGVLTKTVSDIEEVLIPITWNVPVTFTVKAKDIAGNLSDLSTGHSVDLDAIVLALGTPAPVVANTDYIINLDVSVLSLPLSHIVIKYGGTSWTVGSTVVGTQNSTVVVAPINWDAGTSRLFRFVAYDIANRASNEVTTSLAVTAPATPSIAAPIFENIDNTVRLSWQDCKTTLPIDYYEVKQGISWANSTPLGKFYSLEAVLPVTWNTSTTYFVKAIDVNENPSTEGSRAATSTNWGAVTFPTPSYEISDSNCTILWNKPIVEGSFSLSGYKIYDTQIDSAHYLGFAATESFTLPITWVGSSKTFYIVPTDSKNNAGDTANTQITVALPSAPTINITESTFLADQYTIKWNIIPQTTTTINVQEYEIGYYTNYGATNQAEVSLARTKGTTYTNKVNWSGNRYFWVKSIDLLGNVGTAVSIHSLMVNPPSAVPLSDFIVQIVDNNVLLYWSEPAATLPIVTYELREGTAWDAVDVRIIGTKTGIFTTVFETQAGTYTYWIAAIDSAGNIGDKRSVTTTVNAPPDYVLKADYYSPLNPNFTPDDPYSTITLSNARYDANTKVVTLPIDLTETWTQHFTNRNWSTPQDQINDDFPLYIQPSSTLGYFEEWLDFQTLLSGSKITIARTATILDGNPIISCDISVSSDNSSWTTYYDTWSVYATNFQYLKYRISAIGAKTATYTQSTTTATITCTAHGLIVSDSVYIDFTSGNLANTGDNLYATIANVTADTFTVTVPTGTQVAAANAVIYNNSKFSGVVDISKINVRLDAKLKSFTGATPVRPEITTVSYAHSGTTLTLTKAGHGIVAGDIIDLDYGYGTGVGYTQTGTSIVVNKTAHGFLATEKLLLNFTTGTAKSDYYTITSASTNSFTATSTQSVTTSGNVTISQPFKVNSISGNDIIITDIVSKTTSGTTSIDKYGTCIFLTDNRWPSGAREFIDVDAVNLTPNTTAAVFAVYDLLDAPNPWFFRALLYNTSGSRYSTSTICSYTVKGF